MYFRTINPAGYLYAKSNKLTFDGSFGMAFFGAGILHISQRVLGWTDFAGRRVADRDVNVQVYLKKKYARVNPALAHIELLARRGILFVEQILSVTGRNAQPISGYFV